jgi:hypothetical protein
MSAILIETRRMPPLAVALVLAAAAPLWLTAAVAIGGYPVIAPARAISVAALWAGVLVAFLSGVRWGMALGPVGRARRARDFLAAAGFVAAGFAVLLAPPVVGLSLALAALITRALLDVTAADGGRIAPWWAQMSLLATALLCLPILALLARITFSGAR